MTSPLPLPDWVPWWANLAILVAVSLFALMFLLMPFAVFGVKGRLDTLEARMDEIQGEIRSLALRLPEPGLDDGRASPDRRGYGGLGARTGLGDRGGYAGSDGHAGPDGYGGQQPPIPPAPRDRRPPVMPPRTEPRLY